MAQAAQIPVKPAPMSALTAVSLRGDRVVIGPILPEDTAAIFLWLNDVEAARSDLAFRPVDWMHYNAWLEAFSKNPAQVIFAIRALNAARILGFVALTKIDPVHRSAECCIRIGSDTDRGQGYGRQAIALMLDYAWKNLNLHRIHLSVFENNRRAIGAYRAAGFEYEGKLRQAAWIDGAWTDVVLMGALRP
jgi:RimJ/RimL family protein N-acetyltransferase